MYAELFSELRSFIDGIEDFEDIPKAWDNVPYKPTSGQMWCRISIIPGEAMRQGRGTPSLLMVRVPGIISVEISVPYGGGDKKALQLADAIVKKTRHRNLTSRIRLRSSYMEVIGRGMGRAMHDNQDEWYQVAVTIPFRYEVFI